MFTKDEIHKKIYDLNARFNGSCNAVLLYVNKEHNQKKETCYKYPHRMQCLPGFVKALNFSNNLEGHGGCVNCIEFSEDGRHLISGSDDTKIILWDVTRVKKVKTINSGHRGNIFTVKFLPQTYNNYVVSGAGDSFIELRNIFTEEIISSCHCHTERVKRIATLPLSPDVYFSASEDGTVRQFDRREKHSCSTHTNNVLVDLRRLSSAKLEAKCLDVNPIQTEIIAIGATDPYIRVYDRRKITLSCTESLSKSTNFNIPPSDCVQYFIPGHLPDVLKKYDQNAYRSLATTYVSYSPNGQILLANIGADNIYIFDTLKAEVPAKLSIPTNVNRDKYCKAAETTIHSRHCEYPYTDSKESLCLENLGYLFDTVQKERWYPSEVKRILGLIDSLRKKDVYDSIELYNDAIALWPYCPQLFVSRANRYVARSWDGDYYFAFRDCQKALQLDPSYKKALYQKILCLHYMGKNIDALYALESDSDIMSRLTAKEFPLSCLQDFLSRSHDDKKEKLEYSGLEWTMHRAYKEEVVSKDEEFHRSLAKDFESSYDGHCNTTTDIKEATFIGRDCEYIAAGSDDGNVFIWDRKTKNIVNILKADHSIVNCVQFHPSMCMMATSGIESLIKLWVPNKLVNQPSKISNALIAEMNQRRMRQDPMEVLMVPVQDLDPLPDDWRHHSNSRSENETDDDLPQILFYQRSERFYSRVIDNDSPENAIRPRVGSEDSDENDFHPHAEYPCRQS